MISVFPRLNPKITLLLCFSFSWWDWLKCWTTAFKPEDKAAGGSAHNNTTLYASSPALRDRSKASEHHQNTSLIQTYQNNKQVTGKTSSSKKKWRFLFKTESSEGKLNPKHTLPSNFLNRLETTTWGVTFLFKDPMYGLHVSITMLQILSHKQLRTWKKLNKLHTALDQLPVQLKQLNYQLTKVQLWASHKSIILKLFPARGREKNPFLGDFIIV